MNSPMVIKPEYAVELLPDRADQRLRVDEIDFESVARVLWRRKGMIIGMTFLLTAIVAAVSMVLAERYTANAYVMVDPGDTQIVDAIEAVVAGSPADSATVESEARVLQSRDLAERVVTHLRLDRDPEFNPTLRPPGLLDRIIDPVKSGISAGVAEAKRWFAEALGQPVDEAPTGNAAQALRTKIVDTFLSRLEVTIDGRSRVIGVAFSAEDPQTAAKAANALTDLYIASQLEGKFATTRTASQWLNERVTDLRRQVQAAEAAAEQFRAKHGLLAGREGSIATQAVSDVVHQLALVRSQRAEAEARLQEVEGAVVAVGGAAAVSEVLGSGLIQRLREQEAEVQREVSDLSQRLGRSHPDLLSARAELGVVRDKIEIETQKILQKLRNDVTTAGAREQALTESLDELKGRAGDQNQLEVKLRALEREATASRTLLETFLARAQETSSQESYQQADAHVVSRAGVPQVPSAPRKMILVPAGFILAFAFSVTLVFLLEFMDRGFRSEEQVEQVLGVSALGLVPSLKRSWGRSKRASTYVVQHPTSLYVESIRNLYTSLRLSNGDRPPRVVLIASSLPNEGKTTLAVSLASLLSAGGLKILVVDTDLRKPSVHGALALAARPGLVEYLQKQLPLTSVIQHDHASGIDVIAAGGPPINPPELLGTDQMRDMLSQLRSTYDIVILDSAPLLAVSDTRILGSIADKTIFLVRWADTRRDTALRGLQYVAEAGNNVVGIMLTMVDLQKYAKNRYGEFGHYYRRIQGYYAA